MCMTSYSCFINYYYYTLCTHIQASRGGKKRAPIAIPKKNKPSGGGNQMSNELFAKLKKRRGIQKDGKYSDPLLVVLTDSES